MALNSGEQYSGGNVRDQDGRLIVSESNMVNSEGTALSLSARTATTSSPDITNERYRGVAVVLNIAVASGTGGLQVRLQMKDPSSGLYSNINALPTAIIVGGQYMYVCYPGASGGSLQQATAEPLPRTFRIQVVHGDASSYTYSVGYSLIV